MSHRTNRPAPRVEARPPWRIANLPKRHLEAFLRDRCVMARQSVEPTSALRKAYKRWCSEFRLEPMSEKQFGTVMRHAGFFNARTATWRGWVGLTIKQ